PGHDGEPLSPTRTATSKANEALSAVSVLAAEVRDLRQRLAQVEEDLGIFPPRRPRSALQVSLADTVLLEGRGPR
ncbi:MAG TPA: hypothetical protein VN842_06015, partial [Thermoplasmata archaeon]|nr:hypothetical protein [Thermoplasmata archaeon]